jgi:hypothetical protein
MAVPDGMFSTRGMMPTTLTAGLRRAMAIIVPATAAAPDMSIFMVSMLPDGFRLIPPESKVTPLPTRTTVFVAPLGAYAMVTRRGLALLP